MHKNIIIKIILVFFVLASSFAACKKDEVNTNQKTGVKIFDLIDKDPQLTFFKHAINKTDLDVFAKGPGPFTFFAPTDDAFKKSGINSTADIDKFDASSLALILSSLYTPNNITYLLLPKGPNATLTMQNSLTNYISKYDNGSAFINGVKIINEGTPADNGILYKTEEVLPVTYSGTTNLNFLSMSGYNLMVQAITKTNIVSSFNTNPSTIFAIPNSVMQANGYDSANIAGLSGAALTALSNILKYHVVPLRIFKSDFAAGNLPTRYTGNSVTINLANDHTSIKGKNNSVAIPIQLLNIVAPTTGFKYNTITSSGVIYSINEMLKP